MRETDHEYLYIGRVNKAIDAITSKRSGILAARTLSYCWSNRNEEQHLVCRKLASHYLVNNYIITMHTTILAYFIHFRNDLYRVRSHKRHDPMLLAV